MARGVELLLLAVLTINLLASNAQEFPLPPSITESPEKQGYYKENTRVVLRCVASGSPTPTMEWLKNNLPLNSSGITPVVLPSGNGTIEIIQFAADHQGNYQCRATNDYGTAMTVVSISLLASLVDSPNVAPVTRTFQANSAIMLSCSNQPTSVPAASLSWSWNSTTNPLPVPVTPSKSVQVSDNGELCFASITSADTQGRLYMCNVYNEPRRTIVYVAFTRISLFGSVSGVAPQLVFSSGSSVTVLRSQQTRLRCFFSGTGTMTYQWTYNGGITLPAGWTAADTELLSPETGPSDSDAGAYVCIATNNMGTAQARMIVAVQAAPDLDFQFLDQNVTEDDDVIIHCASNATPPVSFQWFKNAEPFDASTLPPRFSLLDNGWTLVITGVCKNCSDGTSDLMVIQCNSSNMHGYSLGQGYINVFQRTVIESEGVTVPWVAGGSYSFECLASCDESTPCTVDWYFDGALVVQDGTNVVIGEDGTLTIDTANDADGGTSRIGDYECLVTNGYSNASIISTIEGIGVATASLWWVGLLVALLVLLLLLLLLLCCFFCYCRDGKSYPVDKNERKNGNDPVRELHQIGFQDYVHSKQPTDPAFIYHIDRTTTEAADAVDTFNGPSKEQAYILGSPTTTTFGYGGPVWGQNYTDNGSIVKPSRSITPMDVFITNDNGVAPYGGPEPYRAEPYRAEPYGAQAYGAEPFTEV